MTPLPTQVDGPLAVIGDVHGQYDKLDHILNQLQELPGAENRWIVFVGDLVDRGPDSRAVLERILLLIHEHKKVGIVCGNHDLAMAATLNLVKTLPEARWEHRWLNHYDSWATFESYDISMGDLEGLKQSLPTSHADLLANLPWLIEHPDYLIVHAGFDPYMDFDIQLAILRSRDYSLHRPIWLCEKDLLRSPLPQRCQKTVVTGHVFYPEVIFQDRRISCDTTGGHSGELSCVLLPEGDVITSAVRGKSSSTTSSWRKMRTR